MSTRLERRIFLSAYILYVSSSHSTEDLLNSLPVSNVMSMSAIRIGGRYCQYLHSWPLWLYLIFFTRKKLTIENNKKKKMMSQGKKSRHISSIKKVISSYTLSSYSWSQSKRQHRVPFHFILQCTNSGTEFMCLNRLVPLKNLVNGYVLRYFAN